jgi:hypothetical protein
MKQTFPLLSLLLIASLLLTACGPSADNESIIATSVALTVQAQASPTSDVPAPSATLPADPATVATLTPPATPTTSVASGSYTDCMLASLVSENPPDGTILAPGQIFLKTWRIQNTSKCTWNTGYKIAYFSGDQMGGGYTYDFPQTLLPGDSADVSIQLAAPEVVGTYKGEWKLQTPDGQNFGVGQYSAALWAEIVVSTDKKPDYGVTSVTYDLVRKPLTGCATNVWFYVTAHVSFSGPMKEVILQFQHSDDGESQKIKLEIKEATTLSFKDEWSLHLGASTGQKWIRLVQIFPEYVVYDKVNFTYDCK